MSEAGRFTRSAVFALGYNVFLWSAAAVMGKLTGSSLAAAGVVGFFLGAALGGWANLVVYRRLVAISGVGLPSHCPRCRTPLTAIQKAPLIGWFVVRGRCATCGCKVSVLYPLGELLGACLGAALSVWLILRLG